MSKSRPACYASSELFFKNLQVVVGGKNKYLINGANIQAPVS
jgi:hypothetical protein